MKVRAWGPRQTPHRTGEDWTFSPVPSRLPLVSVIVACYGQLDYTKKLVASLQAHAGCDYELILIDNGCPDGTVGWASQQGYRFHRFMENQGVPKAYNQGVKLAKGEIVALWNNDMLCHPGGLNRLAEATYRRGIAAQTGGSFTLAGDYEGPTGDPAWSDYADGYALCFRKQVWEEVGPWDEAFFPSYGDDTDWGLRARLKGYDFSFVPGAVHHFGQATSKGMKLNETVKQHQDLLRSRYLNLGLGQRVAVLRWGAAGDLIMATPVLRALKAELPLARLHVHCEPGCGRVLAGLPYVDGRVEGAIDPRRYTRIVDLNNAYEWGQRSQTWEHPTTAYCRRAGVEFDGEPYDFAVPEDLRDWASGSLAVESGDVLIGCGLRSGTRDKQNWNRWLEFAGALPKGYRLVALDSAVRPPLGQALSPDDQRFYEHPAVLDRTGTPTLQHAAALLERCDAFVGVDSGLLHVAAALGKPVVCVCAAAPLESRLPLVGPAAGLNGKAKCFPCQYRDECPPTHCLDPVRGKQVVEQLRELLA